MTFFSRLATTALTSLAALGFASASYATPSGTVPQESSLEAHVLLINTIERYGVDFIENHDYCQQNPSVNGFYSSTARVLVVCNDLYSEGNRNPKWTANDLDTLRHEAQHMIQDCMIGGLADSRLKPVYRDPIGLASDVLGYEFMDMIKTTYRAKGADNKTVVIEWEAFSVAALNVPLEQSQDMVNYCGV